MLPKYVNNVETRPIQQLQKKFPVHTSGRPFSPDETDVYFEDIYHPGIAFAGSERIKVLLPSEQADQLTETIAVPKFWNPPEYGANGVRGFLGNNGHRFMTRDEAELLGSIDPKSGKETIFVSVASYRDPECSQTVESIFAQAKYPYRIRVAVVDQVVESEDPKCTQPNVSCDQDPSQILCQFAGLIDVYQLPAILSVGPVFARHLAHRMVRNRIGAMALLFIVVLSHIP
jgi:hypothetical protein